MDDGVNKGYCGVDCVSVDSYFEVLIENRNSVTQVCTPAAPQCAESEDLLGFLTIKEV